MARFFGRFEHTLDGKGRLILPAKFRAHFESGGFLTENHDGCVALWTPEEFDKQMSQMLELSERGGQERNLVRFWASTSAAVDIDRQGRLPVPLHLRQFAGFASEVLVHGAIDRIELWDPTRWEEKVRPQEQLLANGQ